MMKDHAENALLTDLYELTMLQAHFSRGMNDIASFEFFVRNQGDRRNFLLAADMIAWRDVRRHACLPARASRRDSAAAAGHARRRPAAFVALVAGYPRLCTVTDGVPSRSAASSGGGAGISAPAYPVTPSKELQELTQRVDERQGRLAENERQYWGLEAGQVSPTGI